VISTVAEIATATRFTDLAVVSVSGEAIITAVLPYRPGQSQLRAALRSLDGRAPSEAAALLGRGQLLAQQVPVLLHHRQLQVGLRPHQGGGVVQLLHLDLVTQFNFAERGLQALSLRHLQRQLRVQLSLLFAPVGFALA
jgi:hypothetical protein